MGPLGDDGFHPLRSLMVALDGLADTVRVQRASERTVSCPGIEGRGNLAWSALDALEAEVGRPLPLSVEIEKAIPSEAGLGGGSSDAAAVLRAADRIHGLGLGAARLEAVAARVGSDVPFFIRGGCQWARGRGEVLTPVAAPRFAAVLLRPPLGLSTPRVYAAFDRLPVAASAGPDEAPAGMPELAGWVRNDLWPAALALAPSLGATVRALAATGARATLLCGSGSCVAGLFPGRGEAEEAAARLHGDALRAVVVPRAPER